MSVKLFGGNQWLALKQWTFPGGERGVTIIDTALIKQFHSFTVECNFQSSDDIMDLLLLANACRNVYSHVKLRLRIPYMPYARQDRVSAPGDAFALQVVANVISLGDFYEVEVWDIHSDVLGAMCAPGTLLNIPQHKLLKELVVKNSIGKTALIAPDAGALKKIYPLANALNLPVVEAGKVRNVSTGKIENSKIDFKAIQGYNSLIVVDDICDGGATFIQLGDLIRQEYEERLCLITTHGIYSKGVSELLDIFDVVSCVNDMRK